MYVYFEACVRVKESVYVCMCMCVRKGEKMWVYVYLCARTFIHLIVSTEGRNLKYNKLLILIIYTILFNLITSIAWPAGHTKHSL